jgi:hypothetical protein
MTYTKCTHCGLCTTAAHGHTARIVGNYIRCAKRGWTRAASLSMFTSHQSRIRANGELRAIYPSLCISNTPNTPR